MMLSALDMGIGSTWIMHFPGGCKKRIRNTGERKDHKLLMMGYSAPEAKTSPFHFDKKSLSDIVVVL